MLSQFLLKLEFFLKAMLVKGWKAIKKGSIIFVVGKSPIAIMEPILCRKKVP